MKIVRIAFATACFILAPPGADRAEALACQPTGDGASSGSVITSANNSVQLGYTFCQGDPGMTFCAVNQGTLVELELSGRADVDITCEFKVPNGANGRICIADDQCEASPFVNRPNNDDKLIRLSGDLLPSTEYRIAVFDLSGGNAICPGSGDGGNIETIECTGDFGKQPTCYRLTTDHSPGNGGDDPTASPTSSDGCSNGQYLANESIQLRARPASGWQVAGWSGTNNDSSRSVTNTVTMPAANRTASVTYERGCGTLSLVRTPSNGGANPTADPTRSTECSSNGQYVAGEKIDVTASPRSGWEMESWRGTDDDSSTSTMNTLTMPEGSHQVVAVYTQPVLGFDSGFETDGFCDWSSRRCNGCERFSCDLADGEASVPLSAYLTFDPGEHRGRLSGPDDADFDLVLEWWSGSEWLPVASRPSSSSVEEVVYEGEPGHYRWHVTSAKGAGTYDLEIFYPGLERAARNHLEQANSPKREGKRSLRAIFDKKSKHFDYLIDTRAGIGPGEPSYEASFYLQPDDKLLVKGKKHQIFQLQQVQGVSKAEAVVELFLQGKKGRYSVAARTQADSGPPSRSPRVTLDGGKWTEIRIVWRAGSGSADGRIELWVGGERAWSQDLDNSSQAVDRAFLGQVTKGSKKTRGDLYFDDFRSSWDD